MPRTELQTAPPPGTPLKCALAGGMVAQLAHTGIHLGKGRVADLRGDGTVVAVSLPDFLNGPSGDWNPAALRTGFRIHAACDAETGTPLASATAEAKARELTLTRRGRLRLEYDLLGWNCHRFTAGCLAGDFASLDGGTWMLDRLESIISHLLNRGRPICWRAVSPSTPGFRYAVTPGKHLQRLGLVAGLGGLAALGLRHGLDKLGDKQKG